MPTTYTKRAEVSTTWTKGTRVTKWKDYFRVKKSGNTVNFCTPSGNKIVIYNSVSGFEQVGGTTYTKRASI